MKTIQMQVNWGSNDKTAITACIHAIKAKKGRYFVLEKYNDGRPKPAKMGSLNSVLKKIMDKANLVLNGGTVTVKTKDELGNVIEALTEEHVYTADTNPENREIAEVFYKMASTFYRKPQRGRKATSTNELAQLFKNALAELDAAEESEDEESEDETADEEVTDEVTA